MRAIIAILLYSLSVPAFAWQVPAPPKNYTPIPVNLSCGLPPLPPLGCRNPTCICDQTGQRCSWQFQCG